jgi:hypothetical protein
MPPNYRQQQGQPLTRNERRGTLLLGVLLLVAAAGLGIWAVAGLSGAKAEKGPCVSAVIASSTGGGTVRFCGAEARSWCASETKGRQPGGGAGRAGVQTGRPIARSGRRWKLAVGEPGAVGVQPFGHAFVLKGEDLGS